MVATRYLPFVLVKNLKTSDWRPQPHWFLASTFASYLESSSRLSDVLSRLMAGFYYEIDFSFLQFETQKCTVATFTTFLFCSFLG